MAKVGDLTIDLSGLSSFLVDVATTRGLLTEKEGLGEVIAELEGNQKEFGATAKLSDEEIVKLKEYGAQIAQIDEALPVVEKLYEILLESRAVIDDKRERQLHTTAGMIDLIGKSNAELLVKYEKTRRYRSANALKGVKTRLRNARAEAEDTEKKE